MLSSYQFSIKPKLTSSICFTSGVKNIILLAKPTSARNQLAQCSSGAGWRLRPVGNGLYTEATSGSPEMDRLGVVRQMANETLPPATLSPPSSSTDHCQITTMEITPGAMGCPQDAMASDARLEKLQQLRQKMRETSRANRKDVIAEANRSHATAKEIARLERKKVQAIALGQKTDAASAGEDLERKRAWQYSIEDNEKWDKKLKRKQSRGNHEFTDYDDFARRKYKKDIDHLKPDLVNYNKQRAAAAGSQISSASSLSQADQPSTSVIQQAAADNLYRNMDSLVYADHKPSEEAIDRVVGKLNLDIDKRSKRSRVRKEEDGEITYINDKNKAFNQKIGRFYDKYTEEIRENIERGTAL
ncbi:hypothetical protein O181_031265 [Austropuccinia psidii MF-1]|uniref:Pre-mRNA-splicing factor SYF2 n=1 Tax=Austropuccinia psidii MF-1 TaxID=1389203 RepID=A0A9Q3CXM8_9BASI|nr:hypothetical protein [Austropuccinia psidii MF-1]